eukprot:Sdes_comp20840_c0_seq1m17521
MLLMFVCQLWSTSTRPLTSTRTPTFSRPRPVVYGRRPIETRTTSHPISSSVPPLCTWTDTCPSVLRAAVTLVFSLKRKPCLVRIFWKVLATSSSMPTPPIAPINSTTVTFAPSLAHTEPSSRPITPPPITTKCSGTLARERAPVEETMLTSSISMPGKGATSEPVASKILDAVMVCLEPVLAPWISIFWGPVRVAWPFTWCTLFFLNRPSIPFVRVLTAFSLAFIMVARSSLTFSHSIPRCWKSCCAMCKKWLLFSRDFDGMHPTFRHVPPRVPLFSTHTVFRPSCAALMAATYPPGPPPITAKS